MAIWEASDEAVAAIALVPEPRDTNEPSRQLRRSDRGDATHQVGVHGPSLARLHPVDHRVHPHHVPADDAHVAPVVDHAGEIGERHDRGGLGTRASSTRCIAGAFDHHRVVQPVEHLGDPFVAS